MTVAEHTRSPDLPRSARPYPRPLVAGMALSSIAYVILCMHIPVALLANAGFDDYLFVQHGISIISGQWLGPYSQMTLAKGPGYPLFLAFNAVLGVPITLSQALLYAGACLVIAGCLFRLTGSAWLALIALIAIQWHPALFPPRIIRDDLSAAQVLLVLGAICNFAFLPARLRYRLLWAAAGGFALGWFWLTREDAIWIFPGLLVLLALQALRYWRAARRALHLAICGFVFFTTMGATLAIVATINLLVYGTFVTVDFKSNAFEQALNVLQSVRVGPPVAFVPVPAKVRQAIDKVSPAFASLKPYFNGVGRSWTEPGCAFYRTTCGDYAGGWFMWALRDGVAAEGHYTSPKAAATFYRQIWRQVSAACHDGRLVCKAPLLPFMPATTEQQWHRLPHELRLMYRLAAWRPQVAIWEFEHRFPKSTGDFTRIHTMEKFLRDPRRTPTTSEHGSVTLDGWFHAPADQWIRLHCVDKDGTLILPITRLKSPDLVSYFHSAVAGQDRFSITVPHLQGCTLDATGALGEPASLDLAALSPGITDFAGGRLDVDDIRKSGTSGHFGIRVLQALNTIYSLILSPLTIASIVVFCATLLWRLMRRRRRAVDTSVILILGIWTLLLTRAAVLILVDISSFPGISTLYWAACFPLLCLAIILSLAMPFQREESPAAQGRSAYRSQCASDDG